MRAKANADRATVSQSFFKTGEGQYGFGDKFLGVTVPDQRRIARLFRAIELDQLRQLFEHELHEARLTAGLILVDKYQRTKIPSEKKELVEFYLSVLKRINNWDIVDSTAPYILGDYALHFKDGRKHLLRLLKSNDLWEQRVAVLGELAFIRAGQVDNIFAVSKHLLGHQHDLIHKAVGWMLREAGKRNETMLIEFLQTHRHQMPRTMLRYAIERLPSETKADLMQRSR